MFSQTFGCEDSSVTRQPVGPTRHRFLLVNARRIGTKKGVQSRFFQLATKTWMDKVANATVEKSLARKATISDNGTNCCQSDPLVGCPSETYSVI